MQRLGEVGLVTYEGNSPKYRHPQLTVYDLRAAFTGLSDGKLMLVRHEGPHVILQLH